jgi:glycerol-3-phosphate O-acyltransferase
LEGYWLVLRAFRYLQKQPYSEKDFIKKVLSLGQKALKLQLIERPESVSKIIFSNALKYFLEKGLIDKKVDEKGQDMYTDIGNRPLIHHYSKEIGRLLRSSHFALQ